MKKFKLHYLYLPAMVMFGMMSIYISYMYGTLAKDIMVSVMFGVIGIMIVVNAIHIERYRVFSNFFYDQIKKVYTEKDNTKLDKKFNKIENEKNDDVNTKPDLELQIIDYINLYDNNIDNVYNILLSEGNDDNEIKYSIQSLINKGVIKIQEKQEETTAEDTQEVPEELPPIKIKSVQGYCWKCKSKQEIIDPKETTGKSGRTMVLGKCAKCGGKLHKMGEL